MGPGFIYLCFKTVIDFSSKPVKIRLHGVISFFLVFVFLFFSFSFLFSLSIRSCLNDIEVLLQFMLQVSVHIILA